MVAQTFDHLCTSSDPMERKIYDAAISRFGRDAAFRYVGEISHHGNLYTLAVGNLMVGMRCSAEGLINAIEHCEMHPTYYQWWPVKHITTSYTIIDKTKQTSIDVDYTNEEQAKVLQMLAEVKKKVKEKQELAKEVESLRAELVPLDEQQDAIEMKIKTISAGVFEKNMQISQLYADLCKMNFSFLAEETK